MYLSFSFPNGNILHSIVYYHNQEALVQSTNFIQDQGGFLKLIKYTLFPANNYF